MGGRLAETESGPQTWGTAAVLKRLDVKKMVVGVRRAAGLSPLGFSHTKKRGKYPVSISFVALLTSEVKGHHY